MARNCQDVALILCLLTLRTHRNKALSWSHNVAWFIALAQGSWGLECIHGVSRVFLSF